MVRKKTEEIKEEEDINVEVEEENGGRVSWSRRKGEVGGWVVCLCAYMQEIQGC